MRLAAWLCVACGLAGCAAYDGYPLQAGLSSKAEVLQTMGRPAEVWPTKSGGETLVYPRGPMGFHTFMMTVDAEGRLLARENALEPRIFALIQPGMTEEDVRRLLGPPVPHWTVYFEARDELVWEWRYCDDWGEPARFNVLFDGTSRRVRSTLSLTEGQRPDLGFGRMRIRCSR